MKGRAAIARGLAAALAVLLPAPSHAEQRAPLELQWEAPAECPQQAAVQQRIGALLSSLVGKLKPSRLRAEGRIEPLGERYRLTLLIHDGAALGTRIIESDSCEDLGGAAAVALGLLVRAEQSSGAPLSESALGGAVDQTAQLPSRTEARPPVSVPKGSGPQASGPPRELADNERALASPRQWHPLVRAPLFAIDAGVLPRPNHGTGLALGIDYDSWRILLGGTVWLAQTIPAPGFPGFSVEAHRASLQLEGCRGWQFGRIEVGPCVVVALDRVIARGRGPGVVSHSRAVAWFSFGLGLGGAWRLHRHLSVLVSVDGRFSTSRPRFVMDGVGEIHRVWAVAGGALVACEWVF